MKACVVVKQSNRRNGPEPDADRENCDSDVTPGKSEQTMSHPFSKNVMKQSTCGNATDLKVFSANLRSIIGPTATLIRMLSFCETKSGDVNSSTRTLGLEHSGVDW